MALRSAMDSGRMLLRMRGRVLRFPRPVLVMGVVNVTPDSFSDGGRFFDADAAVAHGEALVAEGAEIIDVGGESTRPGARPVSEREELRRVIPVIERLVKRVTVPVSIDTMKPGVARDALEAGASLVNDVGANRSDDQMWLEVARRGAGYVCMHMRGEPATMQREPVYADVVGEVNAFFRERLRRLAACGVSFEQVILDVGIGFGKTVEHNLQLITRAASFKRAKRPLLLGVSRKSFIGRLLGVEVGGRLAGSLACACWAVGAGVHIIRAHDVAETLQAVRMTEVLMAKRGGERG
jgi:dihydropteroate synthase